MTVKRRERKNNPFFSIVERQSKIDVLVPPTKEELLKGWPDDPQDSGKSNALVRGAIIRRNKNVGQPA